MIPTLKLLARFVACVLVSYLAMAFLVWEWNPGQWEQEYRLITAGLLAGSGWWFFGILKIFSTDRKNENP